MTLVVHVAGLADLGIQGSGKTAQSLASQRLAYLSSIGNAEDALSAIFEAHYDKVQNAIDSAEQKTLQSSFPPPLQKTLSTLAEEGTPKVDLLLVGSDFGFTTTSELTEVLHEALSRWSTQVEQRFGFSLTLHPACILESLNETHNKGSIEQAIRDTRAQSVLLTVGSGASILLLTVAGTLNQLFANSWRYINLKDGGIHQVGSLEPSKDPLRGWLLGLGLPTIAEHYFPNDEEIRAASEQVKIALAEQPEQPSTTDYANALGLLTALEIARGDLGAAIPLRAWLEHAPQNPENSPILRQMGKDGTHRLDSILHSNPDLFEEAHAALNPLIPDWLSWPNTHACLLYAQGYEEPSAESLNRRQPLIVTLTRDRLPSSFDHHFGMLGSRRLSVFAAASSDTEEKAQRTRDFLSSSVGASLGNRSWSFAPDDFTISNYVESTPDHIRTLHDETLNYLHKLSPRPRMLIVTSTGEKLAMLSLLSSAQEFGATYGIPVFLLSSVRDENRTEHLQFHQFGLNTSTRTALLEAARFCLDRFDFYSVARILNAGDPEMQKNSPLAHRLARNLQRAMATDNLDSEAPTILDALDVIKEQMLQDSLPVDVHYRLIVIAAELVSEALPDAITRSTEIFRLSNEDEIGGDARNLTPPQLRRLLKRVRNKLPITHGRSSLNEAIAQTLSAISFVNSPWTYPELLDHALKSTRSQPNLPCKLRSPGIWYRDYQKLREALNALGADPTP